MGFTVINRGGVYEVQRDGQVLYSGLNGQRMAALVDQVDDKDLERTCRVALGLPVEPGKPQGKAAKADDDDGPAVGGSDDAGSDNDDDKPGKDDKKSAAKAKSK